MPYLYVLQAASRVAESDARGSVRLLPGDGPVPVRCLDGAPFTFAGSGDEVVGGEGDGLVVVFVCVVVHAVDTGVGFSESDVGELVDRALVGGEGEAMFAEEEIVRRRRAGWAPVAAQLRVGTG